MKRLKIQNLILVEKGEIAFGPGLNILTGETGSGKSAILSAIHLIAGERADAGLIRKGAEFAIVEAVLEEGIFVRREIYLSGKNRCFLDDQQVTLAELKERVNIERVDQSSSAHVFQEQKKMLDLFAGITDEVKIYEKSVCDEREKKKELETLLQTPKERELDWASKDLALIQEAAWDPGEEEKLSAEHHFLTHAQELSQNVSQVAFALNEGPEIPHLKRILVQLEHSIRFDPNLTPYVAAMKGALLELEEVARSVQHHSDRLEADPRRLAFVEERISKIESLKRRFGPNIQAEKEKLQATIDRLATLDDQIGQLRTSIVELEEKNRALFETILKKRKEAAPRFSAQVLGELKSLNIPHAKFEIEVNAAEVAFLFSANPGLAPIPLEQCASGGELSRLLLAIKTILADGDSTLVFDEIDSNVGGQTASILGQKLVKLAQKRQVICVTHFVQVAKCAIDHFLVTKVTEGGNAYTLVKKLDAKEKEIEYGRMLGSHP